MGRNQHFNLRGRHFNGGLKGAAPDEETWQRVAESLVRNNSDPTTTLPPSTERTINGSNAIPASQTTTATAPATPQRKEVASGEAFFDLCARLLPNENLAGYDKAWKRRLDEVIVKALKSSAVRMAVTEDDFGGKFPKLLSNEVQKLALSYNRPLPSGNGNCYDFMLMHHADGTQALKRHVRDTIRSTAGNWFHQHYREAPTSGVPPHDFADRRLRNDFIRHGIMRSHITELPDAETQPARNVAFRAALKHTMQALEGFANFNLGDPALVTTLQSKLAAGVRKSACDHLRHYPDTSLDYGALLTQPGDVLAPDVAATIDSFVTQSLSVFETSYRTNQRRGASLG